MKTQWDYTQLAEGYVKRPGYAHEAIDQMLSTACATAGKRVCDVGAGVAHLTLMLADRGLSVTAVEPNDAMRRLGQQRTSHHQRVRWVEGTGETTDQPDRSFDLVTFGSSFNVTDRLTALQETARILKPNGWFAALWNHRDLLDPVQHRLESIIQAHIPDYAYGSRREDQSDIITASGLFGPVHHYQQPVVHHQSVDDCLEAWRSHGTLQRQAGNSFDQILNEIEHFLRSETPDGLTIPYTTGVWMAQVTGC